MSPTRKWIRKWTMLSHRWSGIFFSLLFFVWFFSGIVMMYAGYPRVGPAERIEHAPAIAAGKVKYSPVEAWRRSGLSALPRRAQLQMLGDRPLYRFTVSGKPAAVWADNGEPLRSVGQNLAFRVASGWMKVPPTRFEGYLTEPDQWTVPGGTQSLGPLWKFSWTSGEEIYVSSKTGEVAQFTTRASRIGAYFGAIPHWIYFTPLRRDQMLWSKAVIWLSAAGTLMSVLGMIAGLWLYSPSRKYRFPDGPSPIPYSGMKRWHLILGLIFGLVTCTWIFSGLMSMSPMPALTRNRAPVLSIRDRDIDLASFRESPPADVLKNVPPVRDMEMISLAGRPFYLTPDQILPLRGQPFSAFASRDLLQSVPGEIAELRTVYEYETYYVDRHGRKPLPVFYVRWKDQADAGYYLDPRTALVVQSVSAGARWNRWLYHGLHSLDLPWLYRYRPLWDVIVLGLMAGGTALCLTSLVIGWRVLKRKLNSRPNCLQNRRRQELSI